MNTPTTLLDLIRDDAHAAGFQSLGQYRKALIEAATAAATITIGEARSPVGVSLGLRLIGDEEVAAIALTQHDRTVTLHVTDQAHAAQIAAAIQGQPPLAAEGEPVGEVRFELGAPSSIFAELYSKSLPALAPGTKLYAAPQPAEQQPFEWPRLDRPAKVGAVRFGQGVSSRLVVEAAQRQYEYDVTPEKEAERIAKFADFRKEVLQPVLAAAGLVEALEQCVTSMIDSGYRADAVVIQAARAALAAYRKGGAE